MFIANAKNYNKCKKYSICTYFFAFAVFKKRYLLTFDPVRTPYDVLCAEIRS